MNGHLKDLECGGRPMTKNELKIKKLEQENQQLKLKLEASEKVRKDGIESINKVIYMMNNGYSREQYEKYLRKALKELNIDKGDVK